MISSFDAEDARDAQFDGENSNAESSKDLTREEMAGKGGEKEVSEFKYILQKSDATCACSCPAALELELRRVYRPDVRSGFGSGGSLGGAEAFGKSPWQMGTKGAEQKHQGDQQTWQMLFLPVSLNESTPRMPWTCRCWSVH